MTYPSGTLVCIHKCVQLWSLLGVASNKGASWLLVESACRPSFVTLTWSGNELKCGFDGVGAGVMIVNVRSSSVIFDAWTDTAWKLSHLIWRLWFYNRGKSLQFMHTWTGRWVPWDATVRLDSSDATEIKRSLAKWGFQLTGCRKNSFESTNMGKYC